MRKLSFVELVAVIFGEEPTLYLLCDVLADVLVLAAGVTHLNKNYYKEINQLGKRQ